MKVIEMKSKCKENNLDEKIWYESYLSIFASMKISFLRLGEKWYEECEQY